MIRVIYPVIFQFHFNEFILPIICLIACIIYQENGEWLFGKQDEAGLIKSFGSYSFPEGQSRFAAVVFCRLYEIFLILDLVDTEAFAELAVEADIIKLHDKQVAILYIRVFWNGFQVLADVLRLWNKIVALKNWRR